MLSTTTCHTGMHFGWVLAGDWACHSWCCIALAPQMCIPSPDSGSNGRTFSSTAAAEEEPNPVAPVAQMTACASPMAVSNTLHISNTAAVVHQQHVNSGVWV